MTRNIILITIWFMAFMTAVTYAADMISAANTIENLVGVAILVSAIILTIKTKCFTKIK